MGLSEQVTQMRTAHADLKASVQSASDRVAKRFTSLEEKIASLGEVDPDLSADIQEVRDAIDALDAVAKDATTPEPEPEPAPVEPSPAEPEPTEPQ